MSKPRQQMFAVDRIEGPMVVFVSDDGNQVTVPAKELWHPPKEGAIYRVQLDRAGLPVWSSAVTDDIEAAKRKAELARRMASLRKDDPGGDTKL